jgi:hypothetical protein
MTSRRPAPRTSFFALLALLIAAPVSVQAEEPAAVVGQAVQVVGNRVYLEQGSEDGLVEGEVFELQRPGESVKPVQCIVDRVSPHHASCIGEGARRGDTYAFAPRLKQPEEQTKPLPAPASAQDVAARRTKLDDAAITRVEFKAPPSVPAAAVGMRIHAGYAHLAWASVDWSRRIFQAERFDLSGRDIRIYRGLKVDGDLSVLVWSMRPQEARYRPQTTAQLFVRQLELSDREDLGRLRLSLGRLRIAKIPGVSILDGAQAEWGFWRDLELGTYLGTLPFASNLVPSPVFTAGVYLAGERVGQRDAIVRLFRHESRISFLNSPTLGQRGETQSRLQAWFGSKFDSSGEIRLALDSSGRALVSAARVDLNAHPLDAVQVSGGYRYAGEHELEWQLANPTSSPLETHRADLSVNWDAWRHLSLNVSTGTFGESTDLFRTFVGAQVGLPTLLASWGGASLGYQEDFGWREGRLAYLQVALRPIPRVQALARVSYDEDRPEGAARTDRDLALLLFADARVWRELKLRLSLSGRVGLENAADEKQVGSWGLTGSLGVEWTY